MKMINRYTVTFVLVILLLAVIYYLTNPSDTSRPDYRESDNEIERSITPRTRDAYQTSPSEKELDRRKRPRRTRQFSQNWVCFAIKDSVPVRDSEDHIISYIFPGTFYRVLSDNSYSREIELDSILNGYVDREEVRVTRANKPYVEQLLDAWSTTTSDLYKKLIDQLPDTMMIQQRSDFGPKKPDEPLAFIKLVYKTRVLERQSKWRELIDTWDTLADKFPDKQVKYLPTGVISKFEKADSYHSLNMPDSVLSMYVSLMIGDKSVEYNSPDLEGHYYVDRRAFNEYISYARGLDISEEDLVKRLNWLCSGTSAFVQTLIKLQLNEVYFKSGEYDKSWENYLSILQGAPHKWYSFKTYGELRHAALYQFKNLGVKHISSEYVLSSLGTVQSLTTDQDLIWLSNYLKGMCYMEIRDTISAKESFEYCLSNQFLMQGSEISLSILPYSHEPALSKSRATETINELIAP